MTSRKGGPSVATRVVAALGESGGGSFLEPVGRETSRACSPSSRTTVTVVATLGTVRERPETDWPGRPGLGPRATRWMLWVIAEHEGGGEPKYEKETQSRMDMQASERKQLREAPVKK